MHKKTLASTFVLMLALGGGAAQAQMAPEQGGQPEMEGAPGMQQQDPQAVEQQMQAQQRMQQLHQELGQLQQQTMEENPELQDRANELDDRLLDQMESVGYDNVREDIAHLEETIQQLEDGTLADDADAEERLQEDRQLQMRLQQAQQEAMQDEEFMQSWEQDRQELEQDLISAMEDVSPRAGELIDELQQLQAQMHQGMGQMQ
ncbi:hypothetical protein CKO15_07585 [Halorhodospira abdelmalekii]|uniref:hypothetical protein n=1 Tax=Halorhodospira abdelmalekii TaxID=421629 RepID=UPI001906A872|nr:hypothetical protein [Halorhodospira abdelmalekii]MBK1735146.1 hypothetical protein [Halorhodospira abdelmalekii]